MTSPRRGEVWLVDLGMAAKVAPHWSSASPLRTPIVLLSRSFRTRQVHASRDSRRRCPSHSCVRAYSMRRISYSKTFQVFGTDIDLGLHSFLAGPRFSGRQAPTATPFGSDLAGRGSW